MGKGLDTGKAFFQGILSKITDPEQKAAAEKLMANETVLTELGNGVEGQSEIDRQLQTLRTQKEELDTRAGELDQRTAGLEDWHGRLTTWHTENRDALADAKRLREGGKVGADGKPIAAAAAAPAGLTEAQFTERIGGERAAFLGFSRDQNLLTREHYAKFGEIVDLEPLLRHPKIAEVGLLGVYELVHKERLDKHKTDTEKAAEEKIRADERQKVLASQASMPYPLPTGAGSGSPLDALSVGKPTPLVDEAVAHYNRLQAEHAGTATK